MSGTWARGLVTRLCGGCGLAIPAGEPLLHVRLPGVTRALVRCPACVAAMDRAADAVAEAPRARAVPAPLPFARFAPPRFDWKARSSGEDR